MHDFSFGSLSPTVLGELLEVSTPQFPKQTINGNTEPSIFRQHASAALPSSAHTLACYLLRFPHVFYFMPLLIQIFPAPISVVTKEAVENQWAQSWEPRVSPVSPFEPLGMGLRSVTRSLITLSKPACKCKWELVCSPQVKASNEKAGVVYTREERLTDSNPSPRITEEKESREKVLFSLSNLRIKSGKEGELWLGF